MFRKIKLLLIFYCLTGILLYHFQEQLIFHPSENHQKKSQAGKVVFDVLKINVNQSDSIGILRCMPASKRKGLLIFFYPNSHCAEYYTGRADFFLKRGWEVWIPDYPTFGNSSGKLTESYCYKWADNVYRLASSVCPSDSIILYGQSFGSCLAAYLGSYNLNVNAVMLESPYYSLLDQLKKYTAVYPVGMMSNYEFPVWKFIEEARSPVHIFYGQRDEVVSFRDMKRLQKHIKQGDTFRKLDAATHLQVYKSMQWENVVDSILNLE